MRGNYYLYGKNAGKIWKIAPGILLCCCLQGLAAQTVYDLMGEWTGNGCITTNWCTQDSLHFDLIISSDGDISGKAGDAQITGGSFRQIRAERYNWILELHLKGTLITCDNVRRNRLFLLVNVEDGNMQGRFYTEGKEGGNAMDGILSGNGLVLQVY